MPGRVSRLVRVGVASRSEASVYDTLRERREQSVRNTDEKKAVSSTNLMEDIWQASQID